MNGEKGEGKDRRQERNERANIEERKIGERKGKREE